LHRLGSFLAFYKHAALFLLNLVVLLVLVNAALWVTFRVKDAHTTRHTAEQIARIHENASLRAVYPGLEAGSIHQLIHETWSRSYAYEPLTQFKERPFQGRFVNVTEAGFRVSKDQGPWPPDPVNYNIFLFGGSTAFGYGLPDDQTIASYLQDYLREAAGHSVRLYNFGRSSYISTQERVLLEQLYLSGVVPDMALFFDGLNEFAFPDGPVETPRLVAVFDTKQGWVDRWELIDRLPMTRLARFLRRVVVNRVTNRARVDPQNAEPVAAINDGKYHDSEVIARVIDRYLENQRLIEAVSRVHGTSAVFVWQPIPLYKYDLSHHLFATGDFGSNAFARYGYQYMERRARESPAKNFLWCADMQEGLAEPLYVDKVHYTAKMSRLLASMIGGEMVRRGLLDAARTGHSGRPPRRPGAHAASG
jgi:hypothetical protein